MRMTTVYIYMQYIVFLHRFDIDLQRLSCGYTRAVAHQNE